MSIHVMRCPETAGGASPAAANEPAKQPADKLAEAKTEKPAEVKTEYTAREWREVCAKQGLAEIDFNLRAVGTASGSPGILTAEQARLMLSDACAFLHQVVSLTSGVLATFSAGHLREIVGHEIGIPPGVIRGDNKASIKETPPVEQAPDRPFDVTQGRDGRKNPRGRKHPLVALIELAAKAAKLLDKITVGLTPDAHDREPLASRIQARADELEQKRHTANSRAWS